MNQSVLRNLSTVAVFICALTACPSGSTTPTGPTSTAPGWALAMRAGLTNVDSSFFNTKGISTQQLKSQAATDTAQDQALEAVSQQLRTVLPGTQLSALRSTSLRPASTAGIAMTVFVAVSQNGAAPQQNVALKFTGPKEVDDTWEYQAGNHWESTALALPGGTGTYVLQGPVPGGTVAGSVNVNFDLGLLLPGVQNGYYGAVFTSTEAHASWLAVPNAKSYLVLVYDLTSKKYVSSSVSKDTRFTQAFQSVANHQYSLDVIASTVDFGKDSKQVYAPTPSDVRSSIFSMGLLPIQAADQYESAPYALVIAASPGTSGTGSITISNSNAPLQVSTQLEGVGFELIQGAKAVLLGGEKLEIKVRGACPNGTAQEMSGSLVITSNANQRPTHRVPVVLSCKTVTASTKLEQSLVTHSRQIGGALVQPNGSQLLTFDDYSAYFWDIASGKAVRGLPPGTGNYVTAAWNPQGTKVAFAGPGTLNIVDLVNNTELKAIPNVNFNNLAVSSLAWSPDGTKLLAGGFDRYALLFNASTGVEIRRLSMPTSNTYSSGQQYLSRTYWTATGQVVVSDEHFVRFFNPDSGEVTSSINQGSLYGLAFNADGTQMLMINGATINGTVMELWNPINRTLLKTLTDGSVRFGSAPVFKPNSAYASVIVEDFERNYLASIPLDATGTYSQMLISEQKPGYTPQRGFVWSADGATALVIYGPYVEAFSSTGTWLRRYGVLNDRITDVAWKPDGSAVLAGGSLGEWSIRNLTGASPRPVLAGASITEVDWRSNSQISALLLPNTVQQYDATNGTPGLGFIGQSPSVYSPDGSKLAVSDTQHSVRILNASTGQLIQKLDASGVNQSDCCNVIALAWHPDGSKMAVVAGKSVQVFALDGVRKWEQETGEAYGRLFWNADGRIVATQDTAGSLVLDGATGVILTNLQASPGLPALGVMASNPSGTIWLAVQQGRLVLVNSRTFAVLNTLEQPFRFDVLSRVAWSADGQRLAITNGEANLYLYKINP
jgi:WD40 repeat protein